MLTFVFGAGASYDSDPARAPHVKITTILDHRPPLAAGLFDPVSQLGQDVLAANPRAMPLVMELSEAASNGRDIEEELERIASDDDYPNTAVDLLALRAYLAELMSKLPAKWIAECQGRTNYVRLLHKAHRWNTKRNGTGRDPIGCVTFNYDALLEDACEKVFGHTMRSIDAYTSSIDVKVFKPHGSASWRAPARWEVPPNNWLPGRLALTRAIDKATELVPDDSGAWQYATTDDYQDKHDATQVWLPSLSIPVRRKADFTMPAAHMESMIGALAKTTTLIAIGWRARERHFLQVLQDHMPSEGARLVAVAESDGAARATVDELHSTGRFTSYAISGIGFSGFVSSPDDLNAYQRPTGHADGTTALTLDHILTGTPSWGLWTTIEPGRGLRSAHLDPVHDSGAYANL